MMPELYFDSHAHYDDGMFNCCREDMINKAFSEGVGWILNAGTNLVTSAASLALAEKYSAFYAACGIHPEDCQSFCDGDIAKLEGMLQNKKAIAVGEIGLDYHYEDIDRKLQQYCFIKQLTLAKRLNMPVIIHDREAHGDILKILSGTSGLRGVLHSFSGSAEMASELLKRGFYISFSGVVTFKNAKKTVDALRAVPPERLLIETDAPYLAPHPMRGSLNYSGYLKYTVEAVADILDMSVGDVIKKTRANAMELFSLPDMTESEEYK